MFVQYSHNKTVDAIARPALASGPMREREPYTPLGAYLRDARARAGLTVAAACRALEVSETTLRHWERGVSEPSYSSLKAMVALYSLDPRELLSA